jgi:hypothetical protein
MPAKYIRPNLSSTWDMVNALVKTEGFNDYQRQQIERIVLSAYHQGCSDTNDYIIKLIDTAHE